MKKTLRNIVALLVLLAICAGVTLYISNEGSEREPIGIMPRNPEIVASKWVFSDAEFAEENLIEPMKEKLGLEDLDDAFSRCSSDVSYYLEDTEVQAMFNNYHYFGTVHLSIGCESGGENYSFRLSTITRRFDIQDENGNYIPVEDWEK